MPKAKILQVAAIDTTIHFLLRPLIDHLQQSDYDVHIACSAGPHTQKLKESGYQLHSVPIARRILSVSHPISVWKLYKLIKQEQFDVVHVHTPVASILGRIAAKLAGVRHIIYTAHGFYFHDQMASWKRRILILIEKFFGRCCTDWLWTVSQEDMDTAIEERIVKSKDHIDCLNSIGVNVEKFQNIQPSEQLQKDFGIEKRPVIGFVGRLVREKGIFELIQAMALVKESLPEAKLLIIGDNLQGDRDSVKDQIEQLLDTHDLHETIIFAGLQEDIPGMMALMNVFTLPSYREGMPVVTLEAMASHLPVVATDIRGCREEVVDGVTGLIVPVKNIKGLAKALIELLKNPSKAKQMGEAGYRRARDVFDEKIILKKQSDHYDRLVQ